MEVRLEDGREANVVLELRKQRRLTVTVAGPNGPVPGARLLMLPEQRTVATSRLHRTGMDGTVDVPLPPDTRHARYLLAAPGHAHRLGRVAIPPDGGLSLAVGSASGTLVLEAGEGVAGTIHHGGASFPWRALSTWARERGGTVDDGRIVVPEVEPGDYLLCPTGEAADECASGHLAPFGELTLKLTP